MRCVAFLQVHAELNQRGSLLSVVGKHLTPRPFHYVEVGLHEAVYTPSHDIEHDTAVGHLTRARD